MNGIEELLKSIPSYLLAAELSAREHGVSAKDVLDADRMPPAVCPDCGAELIREVTEDVITGADTPTGEDVIFEDGFYWFCPQCQKAKEPKA